MNYAVIEAVLNRDPREVRDAREALEGLRVFVACGRPTRAGTPCRRQVERLMRACRLHVADDERRAAAAERARLTAIVDAHSPPDLDPACWTRPVTDEDRQAVADLPTGPREVDAARVGTKLICQWQQGRCAVCGGRRDLVVDHDHVTALVRGVLCQNCNGQEPHAEAEFAKYRQRSPAVMLGVSVRYEHPFYGLVKPCPDSVSLDRDPSFLVAAALAR